MLHFLRKHIFVAFSQTNIIITAFKNGIIVFKLILKVHTRQTNGRRLFHSTTTKNQQWLHWNRNEISSFIVECVILVWQNCQLHEICFLFLAMHAIKSVSIVLGFFPSYRTVCIVYSISCIHKIFCFCWREIWERE